MSFLSQYLGGAGADRGFDRTGVPDDEGVCAVANAAGTGPIDAAIPVSREGGGQSDPF